MAKELKLKVRKFVGLIPTFREITGEKPTLRGGAKPTINYGIIIKPLVTQQTNKPPNW